MLSVRRKTIGKSCKKSINSTCSKTKKATICCICLESIAHSDLASLNACDHLYHKDCILSWSRIENACPLCKCKFNEVLDISKSDKIEINDCKQEAAYHIELGNIIWVDCECIMCGSDDNEELLLLCDGCDCAAHTYCVGLGNTVPEGDYYCHSCRAQFGDLLEMGYSPSTMFITPPNQIGTLRPSSNYNHLSHSEHDNDSDEEYQPSPQRGARRSQRLQTQRTRTRTRSRERETNNSSSKRKRRGRDNGVNMMATSDEEYVPNRNHNVQQRRRGLRRSQRIRNIQQRASTPDIDVTNDTNDKHDMTELEEGMTDSLELQTKNGKSPQNFGVSFKQNRENKIHLLASQYIQQRDKTITFSFQ